MIELKAQNESFFRASRSIELLFLQGVQHVIISPGSRSTPLTLAAAAHPKLQKHIILDERSAAFFALGIGKASRIPAALICTSGTAAANYYPAVIESAKSGVPLIVMTADRPEHLRNTDANQTINQLHLYGDYPVFFRDFNKNHYSKTDIEKIKKWTLKAFETSIVQKGPAHLNFPFDKPFTPDPAVVQQISNNYQTDRTSNGSVASSLENTLQFPAPLKEKLSESRKPLIIIGQLVAGQSAAPIFSFAKALNIPVLSEQGNQNDRYFIQNFDGFLRRTGNLFHLEPDLILQFGRPPASKSLLMAMDSWNSIFTINLHHPSKKDESSIIVNARLPWKKATIPFAGIEPKKNSWLEDWKKSEALFSKYKQQQLDEINILTDGHVYEEFSLQIPDDFFLFFSNSFAARDRSLFGAFDHQHVFTNRGASGIDGITSTAMGISKATGKAGVLFTGDLAFLHDTNALLNQTKIDHPLVTIVINNSGGSIFRMLPIANQQDYFETYFETPQSVNISQLAKSYDIPTQSIKSITELQRFSLKDWINSNSGFSVIECQTNADASMKLRNKLWDIDLWN